VDVTGYDAKSRQVPVKTSLFLVKHGSYPTGETRPKNGLPGDLGFSHDFSSLVEKP
jgi:hypothetical protein